MDKPSTRKRSSTTANNPDMKFRPTKTIKNEVKLDKLSKAKLIEKCAELETALKELEIIRAEREKQIKNLNERLEDLQKINDKKPVISSSNTQTYPINDVDFNCGVCIFQTTKENCLWDHMDSEHDVHKETDEDYMECNLCNQTYVGKNNLMNHKQQIHGVKESCKYFARGACLFSAEVCWYSHENIKDIQTSNIEEIICKFCEKQFSSKIQFMKHRISNHKEKVPLCRKNITGTCMFNTDCWYIHKNENETQNNVSETQSLEILRKLETRLTSMENHIRMEVN